jgi:hypothetical protein
VLLTLPRVLEALGEAGGSCSEIEANRWISLIIPAS